MKLWVCRTGQDQQNQTTLPMTEPAPQMSSYYWKAAHVSTRALLPDRLVKGRAYFVDDESIIIVDHGRGPVEYGGVPGPQGAPGEPQPQLQAQIDSLTEASTSTSATIWELWQRVREKDSRQGERLLEEAGRLRSEIAAEHAETLARLTAQASTDDSLQSQIDSLSEAATTTSKTLWTTWTETLKKERDLRLTDELIHAGLDELFQTEAAHHEQTVKNLTDTNETLAANHEETLALLSSQSDTDDSLQEQIDSLSDASQRTSATIWRNWQATRSYIHDLILSDAQHDDELSALSDSLAETNETLYTKHDETLARLAAQQDTDDSLQGQIDALSSASQRTSKTVWDNWQAFLTKAAALTETDSQHQESIDTLRAGLSSTREELSQYQKAASNALAELYETDSQHQAAIETLDDALTSDRWTFARNHEETLSLINEQSRAITHTARYTTEHDAQLQEQVDTLSLAVIKLSTALWNLAKSQQQERAHIAALFEDYCDRLQSQVNSLTSAALSLSDAVHTTLTSYHKKIARLFEALTTLHPTYSWPEEHTPSSGDSNITGDPLDGEVITTDYGSWGIEQTINPDGSMTFELVQQDKMDNQILTTRYGSWVIEETPNDDGTVSYELTLRALYIDALKAGDKVQAGEDKYTITSYEKSDGMITLTMSKD